MHHFPFPACVEREELQWVSGPQKVNDTRVYYPRALQLNHLNSTKPIFEKKNSTLFTCHMQNFTFLASTEKGTPHWTPKVNDTNRCMTPSIQIGSYGVNVANFCEVSFHFIYKPHAESHLSCIHWKGQSVMNQKVNESKRCMTLGHSNWTIWSPRNPFLLNEFPL